MKTKAAWDFMFTFALIYDVNVRNDEINDPGHRRTLRGGVRWVVRDWTGLMNIEYIYRQFLYDHGLLCKCAVIPRPSYIHVGVVSLSKVGG